MHASGAEVESDNGLNKRFKRKREIAEQIRKAQAFSQHSSPVPSFFNVMTDLILDLEEEITALREEVEHLRGERKAG